jgi:hypothetical protein
MKQDLDRNDVTDTSPRSRGAKCPSCASTLRPAEGVGNAGCPPHPQPRVQNKTKHTSIVTARSSRIHPAFPHAMVLTVSFVLSPVIGLFCHRRLRIKDCLRPVGPTCLRKFDAGVEASGPHDFAVRGKHLSSACPVIAHRRTIVQPALPSLGSPNAAASTASHPASVTIAIRPFVGGTGEF